MNCNETDIISMIPVFTSLSAVFLSLFSLNLARKVLRITSTRDSFTEAEIHTKRLKDIITDNKLPKSEAIKSNLTESTAKKFIKKYDSILVDMNISCSAFTTTRRLAQEKFAYENIGFLYCDFIRPNINMLRYINKTTNRYGDIVLIYRLWSIRQEIFERNILLQKQQESIKNANAGAFKVLKRALKLFVKFYYLKYLKRMKVSDGALTESKDLSRHAIKTVFKARSVSHDSKKSIKRLKRLERNLEKLIKDGYTPWGMN